jgi:hexokinase
MVKRPDSLGNIEHLFNLDSSKLLSIRDAFHQEIQKATRNEASSLKNEAYFLRKASGNETGLAATLDLGGTNVRAHLIELKGQGSTNWLHTVQRRLRCQESGNTCLKEQSSAEQLFDLQVQTLAMLKADFSTEPIPLGYVFSYPVTQTSLNHAILIRWAKEIKTPGVEGRDVVTLLQEALVRNNLDKQIIPKLVMNDTIGTFMASTYNYPDTTIGSVIGTGYNTCYLQPAAEDESGEEKIINLECGNFDKVPTTYYDELLCQQSSSPGSQKLEKMVSGHYLGELFRLIMSDTIIQDRFGPPPVYDRLHQPHSIDSSDLSTIIGDDSADLHAIKEWSSNRLAIRLDFDECRRWHSLAVMVAKRSASLVAATYAAIINHLDPQGTRNHVIAVNGSLYEKIPGYKDWLSDALHGLLTKAQANTVTIRGCPEGPALGAAVAVCMLAQSNASF